MRFSPSDRRFWLTTIILALLTVAVMLVVNRVLSGRIADLTAQIGPLDIEIRKGRTGARPLNDEMRNFAAVKAAATAAIVSLEKRLEFPFPDWVAPPSSAKAGEYFVTMHSERREGARASCTVKGVQLLDGDLGFDRSRAIIDRERAIEDLKSLSIVEKLIVLLTEAKVTAIVKVSPQDSLLTGSFSLIDNPAYTPTGGQPKKKRVPNPAFIREYPIRLEIICDVTTLMRFLASVRQEKQFFLIRDITIRADPPEDRRVAELVKPGEVFVTIAAAAMRFLSPEEHRKQIEDVRKSQQWLKPRRAPTVIEPLGY